MSASYPKHLLDWCSKQLNTLMGFSDEQLTLALLAHTTFSSLNEHTKDMIGDNKAVREFSAELWRRKTGEKVDLNAAAAKSSSTSSSSSSRHIPNDDEKKAIDPTTVRMVPLKRDDDADGIWGNAASATTAAPSTTSTKSNKQQQQQQQPPVDLNLGRNVKVKYAQSRHGNTAFVRSACHCLATQHELYTNCTACGKIVCMQEGEGPCFFCGSMVTKEGTFISDEFNRYMKGLAGEPVEDAAAAAATSSSTSTSEAAGLQKAEAQRNKLLSFASSKSKGSQIYDDQNDWYEFESNNWLSTEARAKKKAEAEKAMYDLENRKAHTISIDIENKKIVHHESDAWKESIDPQAKLPKWTDEEPETVASSSSSSSAASSSLGFTLPHGERMAQALGSGLADTVEEMKVVSNKQYFHNDTLSGRAAAVYRDLQQSLRAAAVSNSSAASSSSVKPATKPIAASSSSSSSASADLQSSLRRSTATGSRGAGFASGDIDVSINGLTDSMSELELEQHLSRARDEAERKTCGGSAHDEDEPTNCAGALSSSSSSSCALPDSADKGMCLSMWQPWASLLVLGIKRFEGRGWFTPYRGRLWIAAGSREPTQEEIDTVEEEYRQVYGPNAKIPFPTSYPTSALLGCVDLTHCWSSEEFQSHRSANGNVGEDSQSAFVFVCTNPRTLLLPQSHSGQHKLYSLPPQLYQSLGPTLKPVNEKWRTSLSNAKQLALTDVGFDIWPSIVRIASASSSSLANVRPTIQVLMPGVVLIKNFLSLAVQQQIIDSIRHIGLLGADTGFIVPTYTNGPQMNLRMLCLGMYWDLNTKQWMKLNKQGKPMRAIPEEILKHGQSALKFAVDYLSSHGESKMFPTYTPDICIANYYSTGTGKLGVHQDKNETQQAIKAGYPVISLSIGDSAEFIYGEKFIPEEKLSISGPTSEQYKKVNLQSGDALLFGGTARTIYHGIEKIVPNTKPRDLYMKQGRLNLTFRKY